MPRTTPEFISWSRTHVERWGIDPAAIGLTPALAGQFAALADELAAANLAAEQARLASMAATQRLHTALAAARATGGACIGLIKAHAAVTSDPNVYPTAGVSAVARPSTLPPPPPHGRSPRA